MQECQERELAKAAKAVSNHPTNDDKRLHFQKKKREYSQTKGFKKSSFLFDINKKVENGDCLNWKTFKGLTDYHKDAESFDTYDLHHFYTFFKELYRKKCQKPHPIPDADSNIDNHQTNLIRIVSYRL